MCGVHALKASTAAVVRVVKTRIRGGAPSARRSTVRMALGAKSVGAKFQGRRLSVDAKRGTRPDAGAIRWVRAASCGSTWARRAPVLPDVVTKVRGVAPPHRAKQSKLGWPS